MRVLRALLGALLWIMGGLVSLVSLGAIILCITVVLLPIGIPLLMLGRRIFGQSMRLFLPPAAAHPVKTSKKSGEKAAGRLKGRLSSVSDVDTGKVRKRLKKTWKKLAPT